nr:hypothetical protein [Tanacetum cinerariifolium]
GTEGAPQFSPERPRVYSDLSPEEKIGTMLTSKPQIYYFKGYPRTSTLLSIITPMPKTFGTIDGALRFVKKTVIAFCLGKTLPVSKLGCVLSQDFVAFCLEDFLRFVSRPLQFVSRLGCVLSQDLMRFVSRLTAFCLQSVAFCLQASCVLSTVEDLFLSFETLVAALTESVVLSVLEDDTKANFYVGLPLEEEWLTLAS